MWFRLRNTARRGRAASPATRRRRRAWRFWRAAPRLVDAVMRLVLDLLFGGRLAEQPMASLAPSRRHSRTPRCARFRRSTPPRPGCPSPRQPALLLAADLAGLAG